MTDHDRITKKALLRFQIISAYLAASPPRGKRRQMLEHLAAKTWFLESGEVITVQPETIRYWLRMYGLGGFEALKDKPRKDKGIRAIPEELIENACRLKLEVPERSIERIISIMENMQLAPPGLLRRSTLHRALQARGLSARKLVIPDNQDLDRWQADYANDLWQADMLHGPWLPDPHGNGKMRRSYLYAFLDDASRLLLYGRFFFKGDLPALELVFKRSLQRYGKPKRVYYDNGMVFKSNHMKTVCAELGIHHPIHTKPYRPMGHGKIEAFNRFCVNHFIAEVKASSIVTLHQLNEAFIAWIGEEYNLRKHAEIGMTPKQRWAKDLSASGVEGSSRIQYIEEEKLRSAFLWREKRTPDKTAVIQLFTQRYKVSPVLVKKKVEVRYDPERLDQIEIYLDGVFRQRAKPLQIEPNRAPKERLPVQQYQKPEEVTNYLLWLTNQHKAKIRITPVNSKDNQTIEGFLHILREYISKEVFDENEAVAFFQTFGPFDPDQIKNALDDLLAVEPPNLHISFYLNHIQTKLMGGTA